MTNVRVRVAFGPATVTVSSEPCTDVGTPADDVVLLTETCDDRDTLTRIEIWQESFPKQVVMLHWQPVPYGAESVSVHFEPSTRTLFVGAGTFAAAVHLPSRTIRDEHEIFVFWGFEAIGDYVLELGELDVFLRDREGRIVAKASVDPPYEFTRTPEGIRLNAGAYGEQWLRFPC